MPSSGFNGHSMHAMYMQTKHFRRVKECILKKKGRKKLVIAF